MLPSKKTVEKLYALEREKLIRLEQLRQQQLLEDLTKMQSGSKMNHYKISKAKQFLKQSENQTKTFDIEAQRRRKLTYEQPLPVGKVHDNRSRSRNTASEERKPADYSQRNENRHRDLYCKRVGHTDQELTFSPKIGENSRRIVELQIISDAIKRPRRLCREAI